MVSYQNRWQSQLSNWLLLFAGDSQAALLSLTTAYCFCSKSFGTYLQEQGNQRLWQQAQQLMDTAAQLLKLAESQGAANITQQQKAAAVRQACGCMCVRLPAAACNHCTSKP
jgi:hypothetical protein